MRFYLCSVIYIYKCVCVIFLLSSFAKQQHRTVERKNLVGDIAQCSVASCDLCLVIAYGFSLLLLLAFFATKIKFKFM